MCFLAFGMLEEKHATLIDNLSPRSQVVLGNALAGGNSVALPLLEDCGDYSGNRCIREESAPMLQLN